jgi:hypothetical protein
MKSYGTGRYGQSANSYPARGASEADSVLPHAGLLRGIRRRIELIGIVMTALSALLAGWSFYQASQWFGVGAVQFGTANIDLTASLQLHMESERQTMLDLLDFQEWLMAQRAGDNETANAVAGRFPDRFRQRFEQWRSSAAGGGEKPVVRQSGSTGEGSAQFLLGPPADVGDQLTQHAKDAFLAAQRANLHGNGFLVSGILFGLALLFGFCCVRIDTPALQISALLCCELATLFGVALLISVPAHFGL